MVPGDAPIGGPSGTGIKMPAGDVARAVLVPATEPGASLLLVVRAAVERAAGSGPCSVLYSGGLDSTIVAHGARARRPTLIAVGVSGSHDLEAARSGAAWLDRALTARRLTWEEVRAARDRWAWALTGADPTARAVTLGIALALEASPPGPVLCGQGADELFLGYAHFRGLSAPAAAARRLADLERLRRSDWPRTARVALELDRPIRAPFLDPGVVDAVLATDITAHLPVVPLSKPVLRSIALAMGIPAEIAHRPKKALQFGSGIARALAKMDHRPDGTTAATPR